MEDLKQGVIEEANENDPVVIGIISEDGEKALMAINATVENKNKKFVLLSLVESVDDLIVPVETPDMFIARVDIDESGKETYEDPTDEEFAIVANILGGFEEAQEE